MSTNQHRDTFTLIDRAYSELEAIEVALNQQNVTTALAHAYDLRTKADAIILNLKGDK